MRPEQQNGTFQNRNLVVVLSGAKSTERVWGERTDDANSKARHVVSLAAATAKQAAGGMFSDQRDWTKATG
jgi:hypothetical protein